MVGGRTARRRLLRWKQRGDARPVFVGQVEVQRTESLDRGTVPGVDALLGSSDSMAAFGHCLVLAPEGGPGEAGTKVLRRLGQCQEETAHLRNRQGDERVRSPFFTALALRRVTSR